MQDKTQQQDNDVNIDELKSELELAQKKEQEHLDGWKRAKADYLNLKKETEKRQIEIIQFANAALVAELLPIFDHFKLALQHTPQEQKKAD
jgi:molecular chaperone GrpE